MRGVPSSREAGRRFLWRRRAWAWRCARGRRRTRRTSFHATKRAASDTTAPSGGQIRRSMHTLLARSAPPVGATAASDAVRRTTCQSHFFADPREAARRRDKACILRHNRALRRRKPSPGCTPCRKEAPAARASPPAPPDESRKKRTTGAAACVTMRQLHRRPGSEVMP